MREVVIAGAVRRQSANSDDTVQISIPQKRGTLCVGGGQGSTRCSREIIRTDD